MDVATAGEVLQILTAQLAAFEAILLAASAGHKSLHWPDSLAVVRRFAGVPSWLAPPALAAVVFTELSACLLLLLPEPATRAIGAGLAACIWAAYLSLMVRAVRAGRHNVDCGCSFGSGSHTLGRYQLSRNALLLAGAITVAADAIGGAAEPLPGSQWLAACALLALYGALDSVMAQQPLRSGETS